MRKEPNLRVDPYRIKAEGFPDSPPGKNYGCFVWGPLQIISSGDKDPACLGWEHVSISCRGRTPRWDEMEKVKQLFWGDKQTVVQFHPPKSEYVNIHPNCLHLWRHEDADNPETPYQLPPRELLA